MTSLHKTSLVNIALHKCTPAFRELVVDYFDNKNVNDMVRFFCFLDEFAKPGISDKTDDVSLLLHLNNMHADYLFSKFDSDDNSRAYQCWSILDDLSYLLYYDPQEPQQP